jgi:pimeloyl-ACP methyl ester carboxylesterase
MMIFARRVLFLLAGCLLLLYAAACTYLYVAQDSLLFFPEPVNADNLRLYAPFEVSFDLNDQQLTGWYFPGKIPLTLMYFGGNNSELSDSIADMHRLGDYGLLMINYRGFGSSSGSPGEAGMKADALALFDEAIRRYSLSPGNIVLIGRSLGSGIAVHVAALRNTAALVLITPYDSIQALAHDRYPVMPTALLLKHAFDTLADVPAVEENTLVLMSEFDSVIPHARTQNLLRHWRGPYTLHTLPGNHATVVNSSEYDQAVKGFLDSLLEQPLL